jgi:trimethylamine--corrinoid protein Co-methyltransferase
MNNLKMEVLSKSEMDAIHEATLRVLEDPGILVNHEGARKIFGSAGCIVNEATGIVKIPESVIKKALSTAPHSFTLHSRDGKHDVRMVSDGSVTNYLTFGVGIKVTEYVAPGKYSTRGSTLEDIKKIARLVDACDNIDWICSPLTAMDLATAPCVRTLYEVDAVLSNSSKPFLPDPDPEYLDDYFAIIKACYGGDEEEARKKPFFIVGGCPSSPLQLDHVACEFATRAGNYGFPMMVLSMAMGAASAPIHLAGTLVTHNAEVLAGVALTQLAHPGRNTFYGSSTTSFDFYANSAPVGSPELGMISAGVAQLAQYYGMPSIVAGT